LVASRGREPEIVDAYPLGKMVRTSTERLRATVFDSGLSNDFWPEALAVVVNNLNRTPRKFVEGKSPE